MSEQNIQTTNTTENNVQPTTLSTETPQNVEIGNIKASVERSKKQQLNQRNNRLEDAMKAAELNTLKKPETISLDDMSTLELPEESKGVDYRRVVDALPDDAKQLLGNLRADYTRKTQALAQQQKELEARMKALTESDFFKQTAEIASKEDVQLDPYDLQSFEARIQQEVARRMQDMFQPIQQQQELQMRQMKLQEFKSAHPDLDDYKSDIVAELQSNHNLSLQDAYFIVKGKSNAAKLAELQAENAERKSRMQEVGLKIGTPRDGQPNKPPPGLKGWELYQWYERNPTKRTSIRKK